MNKLPILRTSERGTFKRCPQKWYWAWRMGLVPVGTVSDALAFGGWVHVSLAKWYCGPGLKRGPHPAETFEAVADAELTFVKTSNRFASGDRATIEEKLVPAKELGIVLLNAYVEHYGSDDHWYVIEPERSGEVDIRDPDYPEQILVIYGFTYDLIYRDLITDRILLGEHKTAQAIMLDHLPLDDQAGSYWAVATPHLREAGLISAHEQLCGITYNFLRKSLPDTRPRNAEGHYTNKPVKEDYIQALTEDGVALSGKEKLVDLASLAARRQLVVLGEVSKQQPKPLFHREEVHRSARERDTQIGRIQGEALVMNEYRERRLPLIKTPTRNCQWDCQFHGLCLLHEQQAPGWKEYQRAMYRVEDPYANHRKSTEETS